MPFCVTVLHQTAEIIVIVRHWQWQKHTLAVGGNRNTHISSTKKWSLGHLHHHWHHLINLQSIQKITYCYHPLCVVFWLKVSNRVTVHSILFWNQTECKAQSQNVLNLSAWPLAFNCGENCQRSLTIAIRGERKKENTRKKSCTYVCTLLPYNYMNTLYKLPLGRF